MAGLAALHTWVDDCQPQKTSSLQRQGNGEEMTAVWGCRSIMARTEPAMLDITGGRWTGTRTYAPVPTAKRYESYEMSLASKVSTCCFS